MRPASALRGTPLSPHPRGLSPARAALSFLCGIKVLGQDSGQARPLGGWCLAVGPPASPESLRCEGAVSRKEGVRAVPAALALAPLASPPAAPCLPQKQPEPSGLPGDGTHPSAGLPHSVRPVKLKGQRAPSGRLACPEVRGTGVAAHPPVPTEARGADAEPARRGRAQRHVRCTDPRPGGARPPRGSS